MLTEERNQRIDHALSSLVETFLPGDLSEDDESVGERHDALLDKARRIINRLGFCIDGYELDQEEGADHLCGGFSQKEPDVVMDLQHAGDMIKKKRSDLQSGTCWISR